MIIMEYYQLLKKYKKNIDQMNSTIWALAHLIFLWNGRRVTFWNWFNCIAWKSKSSSVHFLYLIQVLKRRKLAKTFVTRQPFLWKPNNVHPSDIIQECKWKTYRTKIHLVLYLGFGFHVHFFQLNSSVALKLNIVQNSGLTLGHHEKVTQADRVTPTQLFFLVIQDFCQYDQENPH